MNVLVVDVGGTNVKILATGQKEPRKFPSGPTMTPRWMVFGVKKLAGDWNYDVVSIGTASRLPDWQQRECVPRRVSLVGRSR